MFISENMYRCEKENSKYYHPAVEIAVWAQCKMITGGRTRKCTGLYVKSIKASMGPFWHEALWIES